MFRKDYSKKGLCISFLPILLVPVLSVMLAACDESMIQSPATNSSSTAITTTTVTTAVADTKTTVPVDLPVTLKTITPTTTKAAYNPVIRLSASELNVGEDLGVSGSGYPINSKLAIRVAATAGSPSSPVANPITDEQGKFSAKINMEASLQLGKLIVAVSTQDGTVATSAAITLKQGKQPAQNPSLLVSPQTVTIGNSVTLSGSGFPANIYLKLMGGVQNPGLFFTTIKTDGNGKFSFPISVSKLPDGSSYQPGPFTYVLLVEETGLGKSVTVEIVAQ